MVSDGKNTTEGDKTVTEIVERPFAQIDNAQLQELLRQGVALVDVRRPEEWQATGVVEGSHRLTFFDRNGQSDPSAWLWLLKKIVQPGDPLMLICRSGHRTGIICEFLHAETGYKTLYNVAEGIMGWLAEGLPVVKVEES